MRISKIIKLFENHSVSVCGMKGAGKDLLTGNVIVRRKKPYVSNIDYTHDDNYIVLNYKDINLNGNTRRNLVEGNVRYYECPYPEGADIYISDCGIYFPSQFCNELNREYPYMPMYEALSRHLNDGRVHTNAQNLNRVWDKIREMSDIYIYCNWVFKPLIKFGIVIQKVTLYDRYDSAVARVRPCRVHAPLLCFDKTAMTQVDIYRDNFYNQHGMVKSHILIYINKAKYDTRHFKELFMKGIKNETNKFI